MNNFLIVGMIILFCIYIYGYQKMRMKYKNTEKCKIIYIPKKENNLLNQYKNIYLENAKFPILRRDKIPEGKSEIEDLIPYYKI
tara:strand:+ start:1723 stop:1974 length:252 start_codon:yes stop_codon:yes gene_type:complete